MKKLFVVLLCLLLAGLCACGQVEPSQETGAAPTTAEIDPAERALYADVLDSLVGLDKSYYALYDIDGDGTKELLHGTEEWNGEAALWSVYAIQNGVAVYQKQFSVYNDGGTSPSFIYKNGTISVVGHWNDLPTIVYYRFEAGELKHQETLMHDAWRQEYLRHNKNNEFPGTPITQEEYEQVQQELEGGGQVVVLDWWPLAEYEQSRKD